MTQVKTTLTVCARVDANGRKDGEMTKGIEGGEVSIRNDKTALRRLDAMWKYSQVALRARP
jgi:hypothetical protein